MANNERERERENVARNKRQVHWDSASYYSQANFRPSPKKTSAFRPLGALKFAPRTPRRPATRVKASDKHRARNRFRVAIFYGTYGPP